jgi:cobalt-precorrin-6B (C15)-methyltransferase
VTNIEFFNLDARDFLHKDSRMFDCAFIGGTRGIDNFLQPLSCRVRRTIVVNAVLVSTLWTVISKMQELGIFSEVVQVQVSRSHELAGSLMFRPLDPVFIIVGKCEAC